MTLKRTEFYFFVFFQSLKGLQNTKIPTLKGGTSPSAYLPKYPPGIISPHRKLSILMVLKSTLFVSDQGPPSPLTSSVDSVINATQNKIHLKDLYHQNTNPFYNLHSSRN